MSALRAWCWLLTDRDAVMSLIADTLRHDLGLPSQDPALPDDQEFLSPGWDAAIERMLDLEDLRPSARPRHDLVEKFRLAATCLYHCSLDAEPMKGAAYWADFPFDEWGQLFFNAWLKNDAAFFEDLARVSRTMAGIHKADKIDGDAVELMVLRAAYDLAERLRRDPSRDEVMAECQRLRIRVGHWGKTLKRCKLGFLKGASRGRPKVKKGTRSKK